MQLSSKQKRWLIENKLEIILTIAILILLFDILLNNIIAVVKVEGFIGGTEANKIVSTLDQLEKNPLVRAIVLRINSPGGSATAIHEIYFKLLKVTSRKPVVASIDDVAASGGYYIAVPSNYIIAKQSSDVGSIGVIIEVPEEVEEPNIVTSGPFKAAVDEQQIYRTLEFLKQDFIEAVKISRGDRLNIDAAELGAANLYIGFDALKFGLIDDIGNFEDAIIKAKEIAGLIKYRLVAIEPTGIVQFPLFVSQEDITSSTTTAPVAYFLYIKVGEK